MCVQEGLGEFEGDATCGEVWVGVVATVLWRAYDGEGGFWDAGAFGEVVVKDEDVDVVGLCVGDGGFVSDADVGG